MKQKITLSLALPLLLTASTYAQNVGIGTLAPSEKLHVEGGTIRVTGLGGSGNAIVMTDNTGVFSPTALSGNGTDVFTGAGTFVPISSITDGWKLTGNTGTNPGTNFVGTLDAQDLAFRVNGAESMRIQSATGSVAIGMTIPDSRLHVMGVDGDENTQGVFRIQSPTGPNLRFGVLTGSRSWIQSHNSLPLYINTLGNNVILNANAAGSVGVGTTAPTQKFDVQNGNARINNVFIGDVGHSAFWAGIAHQNQISPTNYAFLAASDGANTFINKAVTGSGVIGFRQGNVDMAVIDFRGNMGIGTATPNANARLQTVGGTIMPDVGNAANRGINFPTNPGGGGGDEAYIRYYVEAGENTKLVIANQNDADDDLDLQTGGQSRINIDGDGSVLIDEGVFFDCNDCGDVNTIDGTANWGDLTIQGRVLSTSSNLHLSPPGGFRVIINSTYRAAGGGGGQVGLDVDGGIRMRKNYYYFQRYRYCNCFGAGSDTYTIGAYDFCAVAHVGFKNNQSNTDEDDDVQCAVYPSGQGGPGEQTNYTSSFTHQYNSRPTWIMYLEAFQDTNGITCAASCINFD